MKNFKHDPGMWCGCEETNIFIRLWCNFFEHKFSYKGDLYSYCQRCKHIERHITSEQLWGSPKN